jgi:dienelactone hydrolase
MPEPSSLNTFLLDQAAALRAKDQPPATRAEWDERRKKLREQMFAAMGPFPDKPAPLEPRELGVLKRDGYRIEKLLFTSRPGVQVTANVYVPDPAKGKLPAVLVVHGHWAGARRDPVVQARCLGLVKLGFFVLAVDAFGAGERHPDSAKGGYHGALLGATLWPTGQSLLGMQVYDNRRAVDYMLTRPEVDGDRLGITGASGGGNQTMYAGALDDRFKAVVPVCSVGNYQAYLKAACCVCEVLPGALRFTEEGDVLGLVAPRALMVINATKDAFQFSVGEAKKSLERTRAIFKLFGEEENLHHAVFESPHAYNQPMREAMYGWMTRWLKGEGKGEPIAEPKHTIEMIDDISCFADGKRPDGFVYPGTFAAGVGALMLTALNKRKPDHKEAWEAQAVFMRGNLREDVFGGFPKPINADGKLGDKTKDDVATAPLTLAVESGLDVAGKMRFGGLRPVCLLLDLDGADAALKHPLAATLLASGWILVALDLRGTGAAKIANDAIGSAPDHNSAEHSIWIGRPLLGQWTFDVLSVLDWLKRWRVPKGALDFEDARPSFVVGIGQAGIVALTTAALGADRVARAVAIDSPVSFVTDRAYGPGTRMGLLAPGILRVGDVPHLAALTAPIRLLIAGGVTPQGKALGEKELGDAFGFTKAMYKLVGAEASLAVKEKATPAEIAAWLAARQELLLSAAINHAISPPTCSRGWGRAFAGTTARPRQHDRGGGGWTHCDCGGDMSGCTSCCPCSA